MLNNKSDFILEYNENHKHSLKRTHVDWSQSRIIFVSPSFSNYQKQSINFKDIYVINDKSGKPNIKFSNKVNNLIVKKFKTRNFDIFLSLSDEKNYSIAFVVIQKK